MLQGDVILATALAEEGMLQAKAVEVTFVAARYATILGRVALQQGNATLAKMRYREALALYHTFGNPITAWCMEGLAAAVSIEGQHAQATRLCAASMALREQVHMPLAPAERIMIELTIATAKETLETAVFEEEWIAGAALTQDEAVDYAFTLLQ